MLHALHKPYINLDDCLLVIIRVNTYVLFAMLNIHILKKLLTISVVLACLLSTAAEAKPEDTEGEQPRPDQEFHISDPLEPMNRFFFGIHEFIDMFLLKPASEIYEAITPDPIQHIALNFIRNLESPVIIANQLLQRDWEGATIAFERFLVNTTIGAAGLVDIAETQGLAYEAEDFGQTLAVWGIREDIYLFIPVAGPSSFRDSIGGTVDYMIDPVNRYAHNSDRRWIPIAKKTVAGLDKRADLDDLIEDTRRNSLDPYATFRNMYVQSRIAQIYDGQPPAVQIPDYEDDYEDNSGDWD